MKKLIIFAIALTGCSQNGGDECFDDQNWRPECVAATDGETETDSDSDTEGSDTGEMTTSPDTDTDSDSASTGEESGSCGECASAGSTDSGETDSDSHSETSGNDTTSTTDTEGSTSHETCESTTGDTTTTTETTSTTTDTTSTSEPEPVCGDGMVNQASEQCDDGNNDNGDGCSSDCEKEPTCGDGKVNQPSEECDDGNNNDGDGCSNSCEDTRHEICKNKDQINELWSATRFYKYNKDKKNCDGNTKCGQTTEDWNMKCGWFKFTGAAGTKMLNKVAKSGTCGAQFSGWFKGTLPKKVEKKAKSAKICFAGKDIFGLEIPCLFYTKTSVVKCEDGTFVYKLNNVPQEFCNAVHCGM